MKSLRSIMGLTKFTVFDDGLLQQPCGKLFSNRPMITRSGFMGLGCAHTSKARSCQQPVKLVFIAENAMMQFLLLDISDYRRFVTMADCRGEILFAPSLEQWKPTVLFHPQAARPFEPRSQIGKPHCSRQVYKNMQMISYPVDCQQSYTFALDYPGHISEQHGPLIGQKHLFSVPRTEYDMI